MKQTLQLKLSQHLTLTPQLQQSIRLLQLSTLELNQELERFLAENPLLEREEGEDEERYGPAPPATPEAPVSAPGPESEAPPAASDTQGNDEPPPDVDADADWYLDGGGGGTQRDDGEDGDLPQLAAVGTTLRDHLLQQIALTKLPGRDRALVAVLIDALDESGYLTQPLEEIVVLLPEELGIDLEELGIALRHLQNLDPVGVGARSPAECLELQLLALDDDTPGRACALRVVHDHIELLAARDFTKLKRLIGCDDNALRAAHRLIQGLNPRPGAEYAALDTRYVVADVIVRKTKNVWVASLNPDAMPKLRINRIYADILQSNRNAGGSQLASQLQEARWLIKNVQQRFETIQRVSQAIVDRQRHFFEHGEVAMRPLVLREIADALDLHESTVSRVTTQKFMATPRGIFELKYFFGSHVATETGGACSATAIRALIKQLVAAEDGKKPLSDSKISQILGQQGIVVARRTIAKYRESLHIPAVNLRKSL
jgi:RNA polymerase sigma-54 factor